MCTTIPTPSQCLHCSMHTDRNIKEALALHKPCRQIYIPSFLPEKKYSPGVLIYNWAEERHKYGHRDYFKPSPTTVTRHDYRIHCDAERPDRVTPRLIKIRHQQGALPTDQFFRHHGKAYDCNKITWYDEVFNGRRVTDQGGCMKFPETRRWSMINDAWKPEKSDYPLQGDPTKWGLYEKMEDSRRNLEKFDSDVYSSVYDKSYNRVLPPGSYQLTRYATPRHMSFKMSQTDRTLWDLEMARGKQPEVLPQTLPDRNPALCQPRHPPVTLFD